MKNTKLLSYCGLLLIIVALLEWFVVKNNSSGTILGAVGVVLVAAGEKNKSN